MKKLAKKSSSSPISKTKVKPPEKFKEASPPLKKKPRKKGKKKKDIEVLVIGNNKLCCNLSKKERYIVDMKEVYLIEKQHKKDTLWVKAGEPFEIKGISELWKFLRKESGF